MIKLHLNWFFMTQPPLHTLFLRVFTLPSGGFVKRDGRPRDSEVLVSRLVDRPLRPMFAEGWANETQVLQWVMSYDGVNSADALAITAAAAALLISGELT